MVSTAIEQTMYIGSPKVKRTAAEGQCLMPKLYGNRWKVIGNISEGGQGVVFRVADESHELDGEWALKRLRRKDRVDRFQREVEILRRLQHDSIIKLVDAQVIQDGGDEASFLVMPIAAHGDLGARLEIYKSNIDSVVQVTKQIASALQHAHESGVIHRDVKPGNILFPEVGHKVWVADFGISLDQTAPRNTEEGEVVGPRFFIAPELDETGPVAVSPAADIYSLGQLIFYMLSGGKRVTRQNVLDERYAEFFTKGQRYGLLRLLLSRMITPIENRYSTMERVSRDLDEIDNWEKKVSQGLLNSRALNSTVQLQQRIAEGMQRQESFDKGRQEDIARIAAVTASVIEWMVQKLEAAKVSLETGGALTVRVSVDDRGVMRPTQIDTGNDTLLEERTRATISVRLLSDQRRTTYSLQLLVCAEIRHNLGVANSHYLGKPGNPMMAVLPMFAQSSEHMPPNANSEAGFFFGESTKYGVPDPIPISTALTYHRQMIDRSYHDGNMAIARFDAADWPAAQENIHKMMGETLSRMMDYINQGW